MDVDQLIRKNLQSTWFRKFRDEDNSTSIIIPKSTFFSQYIRSVHKIHYIVHTTAILHQCPVSQSARLEMLNSGA